MQPAELGKSIAEMEAKMIRHAQMLEFEEAAEIRDQIKQLKEQVLKS
jgi:excinuclease ABC subunit B